mmetsp:Transcript_36957/g.83640  ORF Transcript_36957/g.83640 Transcript_36957/m.83640 type:complete len:84 (-) Transcript_36957:211-462(-)
MVGSDVGALDGVDEAMAEGALVSVVVGAPVGEGHDVQGMGAGRKADFLRDGCAVRVGKTPFSGGDKMVYIPQDLPPPVFARES